MLFPTTFFDREVTFQMLPLYLPPVCRWIWQYVTGINVIELGKIVFPDSSSNIAKKQSFRISSIVKNCLRILLSRWQFLVKPHLRSIVKNIFGFFCQRWQFLFLFSKYCLFNFSRLLFDLSFQKRIMLLFHHHHQAAS